MKEEPVLLKGDLFVDERGTLTFVNDFRFNDVERFYIVSNHSKNIIRAWQGHKVERKYFYALNGVFIIFLVKIDDWEKPSLDLEVKKFVLTEKKSQILIVPQGYANGIIALEKNSKLLVFSSQKLEDAKKDDYRFKKEYWVDWNNLR